MQKTLSIIQPEELLNIHPSSYILIDASAGSKARYDVNHLTGAFFIDLNTDLADIDDFAVGGRHPLPVPEDFSKVLGQFGIDKSSHVIIYDDKNGGNAAARFWWMLKAVGHDKVQVLNGGFQAAVNAGYATDDILPQAESKKPYPVSGWQLATAQMNEVEEASETGGQTIIDVRDADRFAGLTEPIDLIAGHIPGAINIPFTQNLDEQGFFLSPEKLKEKYKRELPQDAKNTIVHCGSGVTACHLLLAMDYAGLELPKLYVGSWSEWSRNDKPMVLADQHE